MKEKQAAVQTAEDIAKSIAEDIGTKAYYALLEEVYTTPKLDRFWSVLSQHRWFLPLLL